LGSLLLFSNNYTLHPSDTEKQFLSQYSTRDLLSLHKRLVDTYLDEASFNIIDAILLLGLHLSTTLSAEQADEIPSFADPTDVPSSDFLEYLQVSFPTHPLSKFA
jgi:hypothetical protein